MSGFKVKVNSVSENNFKSIITTRSFDFIVDESVSGGGNNEGPSPIDYFLASLAGCFNVSARIVAKERNLDIGRVCYTVECSMQFDHPGEIGKSRAIFNRMDIRITSDSGIDRDTLKSWLEESSERCAVSYAIRSPIPIGVVLCE